MSGTGEPRGWLVFIRSCAAVVEARLKLIQSGTMQCKKRGDPKPESVSPVAKGAEPSCGTVKDMPSVR